MQIAVVGLETGWPEAGKWQPPFSSRSNPADPNVSRDLSFSPDISPTRSNTSHGQQGKRDHLRTRLWTGSCAT